MTASDGLGVSGVTVTFAVASGGGSVGSATAVTNSTGLAQTTWKLGSAVGAQTVTATAGTLVGLARNLLGNGALGRRRRSSRSPASPQRPRRARRISTVTVLAADRRRRHRECVHRPGDARHQRRRCGCDPRGTATVNAVAGVATFSGLQITKSGTGYSLAASSTGLTGASTNNFDITAGVATKLAFTTQPTSNIVGLAIGTPVVTAQDQYGNTVTTFTGLVTLAIATNPGASTLGGSASVNAVLGVASFSANTLNHVGTGYALSATATGLTAATSAPFNVFTGGAATLVVASGIGQSANINSALGSPIVVQVQDLGGNGVPGVTVTFGIVFTAGGSLSVTSGVSDASGYVSTMWTLGSTVGSQTLTATSTGLAGSPLTVNATGTVTLPHFVVTTQPGATQTAGVTITPNFVVAARDAGNNPIPGFTGNVTIAIGTNPGERDVERDAHGRSGGGRCVVHDVFNR